MITPEKLERIIDCVEKIAFYYNDKKPEFVSNKIKECCDFEVR